MIAELVSQTEQLLTEAGYPDPHFEVFGYLCLHGVAEPWFEGYIWAFGDPEFNQTVAGAWEDVLRSQGVRYLAHPVTPLPSNP